MDKTILIRRDAFYVNHRLLQEERVGCKSSDQVQRETCHGPMYIVLNLSHVLQLSIITGQSYYDNIPSIGKGTASITVPFRPAKNMAKSVDLEAGMKTIIIGQKENLSNFASSDCHSERVWSFAISNS